MPSRGIASDWSTPLTRAKPCFSDLDRLGTFLLADRVASGYAGRIMRIEAERVTLHTKHPFRIARPGASVEGRDLHRLIVKLEHHGIVGVGEAAPTPYYRQSVDSAHRCITMVGQTPGLLGDDPMAVVPIVGRLLEAFDDQRAAVAAIDAALHDWIGKKLNIPVWRLLGLDASSTPHTSMTIGLDEPDVIARKIEEARDFAVLKIKVGTDRDVETLTLVRQLAPDRRLRLDANGVWTPDTAIERILVLARFDPELIEQPIAAGQLDALREIHSKSPVPIFVDEDCVRPRDVPPLAGCVTGVNIKLAKCGGIREALRMIELARTFDLKVMLGCMVESSVGISAAAQLASLADLVDLDGHLLLEDDPFEAVALDGDRVIPFNRPGLGIRKLMPDPP